MKVLPLANTWVRRTDDSDMPFLVEGYEEWHGKTFVRARPLVFGLHLSKPMLLEPDLIDDYYPD